MAEYEDEPSSAVSSPMSGAGAGGWNTQAGPQLIEVEPELGGDGEKKFKCSFCPNKVFKKKPEVRFSNLWRVNSTNPLLTVRR